MRRAIVLPLPQLTSRLWLPSLTGLVCFLIMLAAWPARGAKVKHFSLQPSLCSKIRRIGVRGVSGYGSATKQPLR
jgi:hypothetical protein